MYDLPRLETRMGGQEIVLCLPHYIAPDIAAEATEWATMTLVELTALAEIRQGRPDRDSLIQALTALTMHTSALAKLRLAIVWDHEGVRGTVREIAEAMGTSITSAQRVRDDARNSDHSWVKPTEETAYKATLDAAASELAAASQAGDAERVADAARIIVELGGGVTMSS